MSARRVGVRELVTVPVSLAALVAACGGQAEGGSGQGLGKGYPPPGQAQGGDCCAAPVEARECLDVPNGGDIRGPECSPISVAEPMRFASRAEVEDYLRGHWMMCSTSHFPPGSYSPMAGLDFSGAGDTFRIGAITWDSGGTECIYVNQEKYYAVKSLSILREAPESDRWVVRFEMGGMAPLAIAAVAESPRRMRLETGAVLVHYPAR